MSDEAKHQIESVLDGLPEEELRKLAVDIVDNKVFTSAHLEEHQFDSLPLIFLPVGLGDLRSWTLNAGILYEYYDKALPLSVNGLPIFASVKKVAQHDMAALNTYVAEYRTLRKQFFAKPIPKTI